MDKSEIRNPKSESAGPAPWAKAMGQALLRSRAASSPLRSSGATRRRAVKGPGRKKVATWHVIVRHSMSQWLDDSPSVCEDGGMLDRSEIRSRKSAGVAGSTPKAFAGGSGGSVPAARENRVSTGSNRVSAGLTRVQTGFERVWAGLNGLIRVQSRRRRAFRLRPGRELGEKTACALAGIVFNMMYVSSALLDKGRGKVWSATIFQFFHR